MNTFRFNKLLVPAQARAENLRNGYSGGGIVAVSGQSIGTSDLLPSQIVNNYITNNYNTTIDGGGKGYYRGRISIANLLALEESEIGTDDMYLVYASGTNEDGFNDTSFTYDGTTYEHKTYFQWISGKWESLSEDSVDTSGMLQFEELKDEIWMLEGTSNKTSYFNVYGEGKPGLVLGTFGRYSLSADGIYKENNYSKGTPGGGTSENYTKTLFVPYCRSYQSGNAMVYTGGVLSDADYEKLCTMSGGSIDLPIDSVMPSNPSDERVPSSKLVKTELAGKANASHSHSAGDITSGTLPVSRGGTGQTTLNLACNSLINSLHEGSSAPADSDFIICQYVGGGTTNTNYYRKPVSALWSYIKSKIDATSVQCDWSETDSNSSAYIKNKPTNVSAFTNDAGYLTSHQSLAEYTKKSDLPMDFAFASRFINTLTTGWIPVCNITLNPTYLCDSSTAVRIARYRYNNNNYVDTTIRIQLRFQSDSYWVAFVSSTSTKNYAYKYAYSINGNVVTIYTYIDNDRYIMLEAYADDYDSTCTYTANTSSAVASGVTEIVDSQTPAEVSVYCGLDYSATNKGLYVTINTLAYWNGLAATGHSNLLYCDRGRFGTIVTKSKDDYSLAGHTHNWSSITDKPIDTAWGTTQSYSNIPSSKLVYDSFTDMVRELSQKANKTDLDVYVKATDMQTALSLFKSDYVVVRETGSSGTYGYTRVRGSSKVQILADRCAHNSIAVTIDGLTTEAEYAYYLEEHMANVTYNSKMNAIGFQASPLSAIYVLTYNGTTYLQVLFNSSYIKEPNTYNHIVIKFEPIN